MTDPAEICTICGELHELGELDGGICPDCLCPEDYDAGGDQDPNVND